MENFQLSPCLFCTSYCSICEEIQVLQSIYSDYLNHIDHDTFEISLEFPRFNLNIKIKVNISNEYFLNDEIPIFSLIFIYSGISKTLLNSRDIREKLKNDLISYCTLELFPQKNPFIFQMCQYLQERANELLDEYYKIETDLNNNNKQDKNQTIPLIRVLIRFHHVKNPHKRRCILEWAHHHNINGVFVVLEPQFYFILLEALEDDYKIYIQKLRSLAWKKISVICNEYSKSGIRKFDKFSENRCQTLTELLVVFQNVHLEDMFFYATSGQKGIKWNSLSN